MNVKKTVQRPGVKIALAVIGLLTVLSPGIVGLVKSFDGTAENAEKKADMSYELLKLKVEFTDQELSALRDDVRVIRQLLMTHPVTLGGVGLGGSGVTYGSAPGMGLGVSGSAAEMPTMGASQPIPRAMLRGPASGGGYAFGMEDLEGSEGAAEEETEELVDSDSAVEEKTSPGSKTDELNKLSIEQTEPGDVEEQRPFLPEGLEL